MKIITSLTLLAIAIAASAQSIPRFKPHVAYSVPGTSMIAVADLNGDGKPDIVSVNGNAPNAENPGFGGFGITVLMNNGDGTYKTPQAVSTTGNPFYVVVADFDGDGKPDLVVDDGPGTTTISFYKGRGDGTFLAPTQTVVAEAPMQPDNGAFSDGTLIVSDFNRDGKPDLAMCYNILASSPTGDFIESHTKVLLGNGTGLFTVGFSVAQPSVGFGCEPFVEDFNRDGIPDLLVTGFPNMLEIGNGNGTFTQDTTSYYATAPIDTGTVLADFNKDGNLDMTGVGASGGGRAPLQWFVDLNLGISNTLFQTFLPGFAIVFPCNSVVADFDGDGLLDVANTNLVAYSLGDGTFRADQKANDFGFTNPQVSFTDWFPQGWLVAADVDGNGSPDLIASQEAGFVEVALNTGGNPPLIALLSPSTTAVVDEIPVTETVTLGAKAPTGGAVISLSSSSPSATVPASITIPAGAQAGTFTVKTLDVATPTAAIVTATYRTSTLKSNVLVVPRYSLSAVSVAPNSIFGMLGGNPAVGTITLTGAAADGTVVTLTSSNPAALTVPATITVPSGSSSVTFPAIAQFVTADTPVTVTATFQTVKRTANVTVKKEIGDITITKAEYQVNKKLLHIEGTTTSTATRLNVYDKDTGVLILPVSVIRGKFVGDLFSPEPTAVKTALVQSTLGEAATSAVAQK